MDEDDDDDDGRNEHVRTETPEVAIGSGRLAHHVTVEI
jgi:hypothetical protein